MNIRVEITDAIESLADEELTDRQKEDLLDMVDVEYVKKYFGLEEIDEEKNEDQKILNALRHAGVDNWEGYEDAIGGME
jgi:hypothetical protein